jgi:predicted nucleic acid-binding protein
MSLYLDTSALVKLYVDEPGAAEVRHRVRSTDVVATSRVAYPEARAALARRRREGGITESDLRRVVADLDRDLRALAVVELSAAVARSAGLLAERHRLRALDAIHLASALAFWQLAGRAPAFLSFDEPQSAAARREGLEL